MVHVFLPLLSLGLAVSWIFSHRFLWDVVCLDKVLVRASDGVVDLLSWISFGTWSALTKSWYVPPMVLVWVLADLHRPSGSRRSPGRVLG